MKVILLEEVKGQGVEGDVIDVSDGFANNYLLRRNMAIRATKGNLKQLEMRRHNIEKREEKRTADAEEMKAKLNGTVVKIEARVGDEGQLFGSVTPQMISDALKEQHGVEIDRRLIDLKSQVRTAGRHEATITLHRGIKADITLLVGDEDFFTNAEAVEGEEEAEETEAAAEAEAAGAPEAEEAAE